MRARMRAQALAREGLVEEAEESTLLAGAHPPTGLAQALLRGSARRPRAAALAPPGAALNTPAAPLFAPRTPLAVTVQSGIRAGRTNEQNDKRR